jgi:hypothetical protein
MCNVEWQGEGLNITQFFVMNTPVLALTLPLISLIFAALSPVVKLPKHEATFSHSYIAYVKDNRNYNYIDSYNVMFYTGESW